MVARLCRRGPPRRAPSRGREHGPAPPRTATRNPTASFSRRPPQPPFPPRRAPSRRQRGTPRRGPGRSLRTPDGPPRRRARHLGSVSHNTPRNPESGHVAVPGARVVCGRRAAPPRAPPSIRPKGARRMGEWTALRASRDTVCRVRELVGGAGYPKPGSSAPWRTSSLPRSRCCWSGPARPGRGRRHAQGARRGSVTPARAEAHTGGRPRSLPAGVHLSRGARTSRGGRGAPPPGKRRGGRLGTSAAPGRRGVSWGIGGGARGSVTNDEGSSSGRTLTCATTTRPRSSARVSDTGLGGSSHTWGETPEPAGGGAPVPRSEDQQRGRGAPPPGSAGGGRLGTSAAPGRRGVSLGVGGGAGG